MRGAICTFLRFADVSGINYQDEDLFLRRDLSHELRFSRKQGLEEAVLFLVKCERRKNDIQMSRSHYPYLHV